MRQTTKVVLGATIVAASTCAISHLGLPRALRTYRDRVSVEMSELAPHEIIVDWLRAARPGPLRYR
jgi:hypothetical protein